VNPVGENGLKMAVSTCYGRYHDFNTIAAWIVRALMTLRTAISVDGRPAERSNRCTGDWRNNMIWTAQKHDIAVNFLPENEVPLSNRAHGINHVFIMGVLATLMADLELIKLAINWLR
jgi:hypothetical protein